MATDIYTLHVAYQGLENKVWRDIEVSGNYRLDQLGYAVLATFDTMAYHLFKFDIYGVEHVIPNDDTFEEDFDMAQFPIHRFQFKIGDTFTMDYDFGTTQTFIFTVTGIRPLEKGTGRAYPQIVAGAGFGIIDDMDVDDLRMLIAQIEKNGKTDEEIYYNERTFPWDFRSYDMASDNALLKGSIDIIEDAYSVFWEEC